MTDYEKYKIKISDDVLIYLKRDDEAPYDAKEITNKTLDALEGHFLSHDVLPDRIKEARRKRRENGGQSVEKTHPNLFKGLQSTLKNTCGENAHFRLDMVESPHKPTLKHAIKVFGHSGIGIKAEKIKTIERRR